MRVRLSALREYLQENFTFVLFEGRIDDARDAFPDLEEEVFDDIVANQPAGSNNKYLMWTTRQVDKMMAVDPDPQAVRIVIQAVRLFDGSAQRLKQRDINQYEDVDAIEKAVKELGDKKTKSQEIKQARADTDVIYQDDRFLVLRPHTTEASCKYGTGTKWCIAATGSYNYFTSYSTNNNKFYFVIDKKETSNTPSSKYALAILAGSASEDETDLGRLQVYDASDKRVDLSVVAKHVGDKWPEIWSKVQAHVKAHPSTREVEDAQKATEEHVASLLKGDKVSETAIQKIASNGKLTGPVVKALLTRLEDPSASSSFVSNTVSSLSQRAGSMPGEAAMAIMAFIPKTKPKDPNAYWSGTYYLERMIENANLSPEDFKSLAKSGNESILANIMANANAPAELKASIADKVKDFAAESEARKVYWEMIKSGKITTEQLRQALSKYPVMAGQILNNASQVRLTDEMIRLVPVSDAYQLKQLLEIPNVPPDYAAAMLAKVWDKLKKYDLYQILKTIPLTIDVIEGLWKDRGQDARTALLQNPAIGEENASKFATSKNHAYRFAVAHNTATPANSLELLSTDESVSTRAAVAANPKTPVDTLRRLARDEANAVRAGVAGNSATPQNILVALKRDSDTFIARAARKTLKSLGTTETFVRAMMSMDNMLYEALDDDSETQDIMYPEWKDLPSQVKVPQFVAVYLLQHNGHATREEIQAAFEAWPHRERTYSGGGYRRGGGRRGGYGRRRGYGGGYTPRVETTPSWTAKRWENYGEPSRTTTPGGKGWYWSPAGINKGAIFRLTPAGAAAAMEVLAKLRRSLPPDPKAGQRTPPEAKKTPVPRELTGEPAPAREPGAARGPKTTYKIYGRFKGHPAATRLKGQAYVSANDTQFRGGEQAVISPEDGKLRVKKPDSDHSQLWDPIDG